MDSILAITGEGLKIYTLIMILKSIYEYFNISIGSGILAILSGVLSLRLTLLIGSFIYGLLGLHDQSSFGRRVIGIILILVVWYNLYLLGVDILVS